MLFALRYAQSGLLKAAQEFASSHGHRALRHEVRDAVLGHVVVVVVEAAPRDPRRCREGVELFVGLVADQVRPDGAMGGPDGRIDEDGHVVIVDRLDSGCV